MKSSTMQAPVKREKKTTISLTEIRNAKSPEEIRVLFKSIPVKKFTGEKLELS